ncbi:lin-49 [Pristionchus pacificus]|nr:lin-49 [Pristionchus pacificus]
MALLDLQPIDLSNGERLFPNSILKVRVVSDKSLPPGQTCAEAEVNYRKAFKTDSITLKPAAYQEAPYTLSLSCHLLPGPFIKTEEKSAEQVEEMVEYDLDEEDQIFLEEENARRKQKKMKVIDFNEFELAIDRLEKETFFKNANANDDNSMDESEHLDDVCCICGDGDVENVNQIIYCDMCNIAVHQDCYGVPYIPEGQWLCRKCKLSPMESVKCELCPLRDGAFKQTSDGKWAHVKCAIWLNEVHFGNTAFLEPIEGVQNSLRRRAKLRCLVCKVKGGACLQCSKGSCVRSFHVTCAAHANLQMIVDNEPDPNSPDGVSIKRFVYCHVHGAVKVGDNQFARNKKNAVDAIRSARLRLTKPSTARSASVPTVDPEAKKRIVDKVGHANIVEDIMGFWFYKRKKRCGLPLIRRLQVKKKIVARVASPRGDAKRKGRIMYERTRTLLETMKKREKLYLDTMLTKRRVYAALMTPFDDILVKFIKSIKSLDTSNFFIEKPPADLPNYDKFVKKPMYFTKIEKNAENGKYETEGKMKEDLDLIFKNSQKYNKDNNGVLLYTKELKLLVYKAYDELVEYLKFTRKWHYELFGGEAKEEEVEMKEEPKKEMEGQMELRDSKELERGEETNKRKRKMERPTEEDKSDTPSMKRDRKTREKEKDAPKEKSNNAPSPKSSIRPSIFAPTTLAPMPHSLSNSRRFSLDTPTRLDSNSNLQQRRLGRITSQPSFKNYRDNPLSPEMVVSCDSAVDSDIEPIRPDSRSLSRSSLHDPYTLHHGDLVNRPIRSSQRCAAQLKK